ncbi:DUF5366 family protein [Alteribacillus sp. HJP-4]|uniref:DUF5366 family protein n=1 Tax=Alteribacillus sp. HJP-4 TaxID=2775394 RepID=UPI0035CD1FFB
MKNTYLTSHFPILSILLFSLSLSIAAEAHISQWLDTIGIYSGMLEFFSETGIKLTFLFLLMLSFFMVFSALKLIADTMMELSLLFFSNDVEGEVLRKVRGGSWIYLIGGLTSLLFITFPPGIAVVFAGGSFMYFIFFVYKVGDSMSGAGMFGMVMFHMSFWCVFILAVAYAAARLYNSFMASLPI